MFVCLQFTAMVLVAADVPGPFNIHSNDVYPEGANQWDKVSEIALAAKLRRFGVNSSMSLPHLPHISVHNVNMSDGVKLSTILINPYPYDKPKGTTIVRSPYGPTSENLADLFVLSNGFAAVLQDDRGTFTSGGKFDIWRTARADGLSTMKWVTSQPWSNGEVFTAGVSADGINEATQVLAEPPMLKGQWWMWTTGNGHHFAYPGGAFRQDLMDGYMNFMDIETHNAAGRVLKEGKEHEGYSDWWSNITICPTERTAPQDPRCHWQQVKWPIVLSSGWWDIFQHTSLDAWNAMRVMSDPSVRDKHVHIVSPLGHCLISLADAHPVLAAAEAVATETALAVTAEMWAGNFSGPTRSRIGRVNLYVMGGFDAPAQDNWNYWTSLDAFPIASQTVYYLQAGDAGASLSLVPPTIAGSAEYDYDPKDPAPMLGGNNLPIPVFSKIHNCGHADQTAREMRKDVMVFDSDPLLTDTTVVGHIRAKVYVSSSANDTDFFITLSDLSAKKSTLIRYGMQRMRWRESESIQSPALVPGKVYEVTIDLASTAYVFPKGHRIRVSVSSAANPYYTPNSNTGESELVKHVTPVVARNVVHFAPEYPSQIMLPTVAMKDIPKNGNFAGDTRSKEAQIALV